MFVKPGIYKVDCTDGSYVYAIKNEHGVSLIDTHFPGKGEEIAAELHAAGMEPVARILPPFCKRNTAALSICPPGRWRRFKTPKNPKTARATPSRALSGRS